jgi:hypothetical protein
MSVTTLVGTPDPDHTTPLPSPATCTCIFTASTAGPWGMNMRVDGVIDPHCPRHRRPSMPQKRQLLQHAASMFAGALTFSPRPKLA